MKCEDKANALNRIDVIVNNVADTDPRLLFFEKKPLIAPGEKINYALLSDMFQYRMLAISDLIQLGEVMTPDLDDSKKVKCVVWKDQRSERLRDHMRVEFSIFLEKLFEELSVELNTS